MPDSQASIVRELVRFAAPNVGIFLMEIAMLAVGLAVCGRLPDATHALAAMATATQIGFLLMVLMFALMTGAVALVSRAHGAKDTARVNHVLHQATMLAAILGLVVAALGAVLAAPLLRALGTSPDVVANGVRYLRPFMLSIPACYLTVLYMSVLRGVGNTRLPFLAMLLANVVNLVLVTGLALGRFGMPALGIAGAGYAAIGAQVVAAATMFVATRRFAIAGLRPTLRPVKLDRAVVGELFHVGWPVVIDALLMNLTLFLALGMLSHLDEAAVAAHGIGLRVQGIALAPGQAIAQATGALVGIALGAGDVARARQIARASMLVCGSLMTLLALAIGLGAQSILATMFDVARGTSVSTYAVQWMRLMAAFMLPGGIMFAVVGVLQGAGATRVVLRINYATAFGLQIPLALILGFALGLGPIGIWTSIVAQFAVRGLLSYLAYRGGQWAVTGVRPTAR